MPGEQHHDHRQLMAPVRARKGARFAIREGGRTVGSGTVGTDYRSNSEFWLSGHWVIWFICPRRLSDANDRN
jgi:hypothetical protein